MKIIPAKISCFLQYAVLIKSAMLFLILMFSTFNLSAQKTSNVKLKIEGGLLWGAPERRDYRNGRFLFVEPKLRSSRNSIIGLRIGGALNYQKVTTTDPLYSLIDNNLGVNNFNTVLSFVPTFDYYYKKSNANPYFGLGIGYHILDSTKDVYIWDVPFNEVETTVKNKFGFLLRWGLNLYKVKLANADLSNFILGIELNFIPRTDIELPNGTVIGTVANTNIALAFGYTFGESFPSKIFCKMSFE